MPGKYLGVRLDLDKEKLSPSLRHLPSQSLPMTTSQAWKHFWHQLWLILRDIKGEEEAMEVMEAVEAVEAMAEVVEVEVEKRIMT